MQIVGQRRLPAQHAGFRGIYRADVAASNSGRLTSAKIAEFSGHFLRTVFVRSGRDLDVRRPRLGVA